MPATFSCTLSFRASYFSNTCAKSLETREMMFQSEKANTTIATMKINDKRASMTRHITMESSSRKGARTVMRRICW